MLDFMYVFNPHTWGGHPEAWKSPPTPLFLRGELKSPFCKGGFRGISKEPE